MVRCTLWPRLAALLLAVVPAIGFARGRPNIRWQVPACEPPHVFYSSAHRTGAPPCCPSAEGVCPGGGACPPSGVCPIENVACSPPAAPVRPNVVLIVGDDQGACHFGHAGECRSPQSGSPISAPISPNLDLLAGYGTVFPVAHNTSPWCFPSLASMLTARYQRNIEGAKRIASDFPTVPRQLRSLGQSAAATVDPYNPEVRIGGYCALLAGKFTGGTGNTGFDGVARTSGRRLGRNDCAPGQAGGPPRCGTAMTTTYTPFSTGRMTDLFEFVDRLLYRQPGGAPTEYRLPPFFIWYSPRIPHQPLRYPQAIQDYLFGGPAQYPRGGAMNLGRWCAGGACAPVVSAFDENNFGTVDEFYSNVWLLDDNIRELRRFLAALGQPHCIDAEGRSRFEAASPATCSGVWGSVTPAPAANTVLIYLADNGWFLPDSKHRFTENGFRTRLIVFDPRALPGVPPWDPQQAVIPPPQESPALASGVDLLPTILGLALDTPGTQTCPVGDDGKACDGRDLRPHLATAPGGPAPPETLRRSLCGHMTQRPTSPTRFRYLLTRPGSVGRCVRTTAPACADDAACGPGHFCLGGRCTVSGAESVCGTAGDCPAGALCIGARCRMAPSCVGDDDCASLLGADYACVGKEQRWCRNAPNVACGAAADCPACPSVNGSPVPCARVCEARTLKLYLGGGGPPVELTDLFLDPDERGLHNPQSNTVTQSMTDAAGYAGLRSRLSCCVDDWWDGGTGATTACGPGFSCPADLTCNQ